MARVAAGRWLLASIVAVAAVHILACPVRAGVLDSTWNAPTTNADGSPVTGVASYRIYYGTSNPPCPASSFLAVPSIASALAPDTPAPDTPAPDTVASGALTGLITGTVYFVQVTAVDVNGTESDCSSLASAVARPDPAVATPPTATISPPVLDP